MSDTTKMSLVSLPSRKKQYEGFTLIEVMIAVAIVGILASIAYPSYLDSIRKTKRADAQAELVRYAAFAERIYTENDSYAAATKTAAAIVDTDFYTYTLSPSPLTTSFTITATATNDQANDSCGNMSLTNTGQTAATGTLGAACWR